MPDYKGYQKSISDQLIAAENRVINFIDEAHWAEDGRYKEIILNTAGSSYSSAQT